MSIVYAVPHIDLFWITSGYLHCRENMNVTGTTDIDLALFLEAFPIEQKTPSANTIWYENGIPTRCQ